MVKFEKLTSLFSHFSNFLQSFCVWNEEICGDTVIVYIKKKVEINLQCKKKKIF